MGCTGTGTGWNDWILKDVNVATLVINIIISEYYRIDIYNKKKNINYQDVECNEGYQGEFFS